MEENILKIKEETIELEDLILPSHNSEPLEPNIRTEIQKDSKKEEHLPNNSIKSKIEIKKPFQCELCQIRFAQKTSLNCHTAAVHEGKKPFLQCEHCNMKFMCKSPSDRKYSLDRHIATVHEGIKNFHCKICDKKFAQKGKDVFKTCMGR